MKNDNIITGIHYNAAHLNGVYKIDNANCPLSELNALQTVSIPFHEVLTLKDIKTILEIVKKYL
jgi:dTDP-4-amino-4,6-dideoxygalactose transaminase